MNERLERRLDPAQRAELKQGLGAAAKAVPSLYSHLNTAQYRAFQTQYKKNKDGLAPTIHVLCLANGCGKTHALVLDMVGVTVGSRFLNTKAFPKEAISYYDSLKTWRDKGELNLRLVCMADDMKPGGSVLSVLKEMFPWAEPTAADAGKCFRQIAIPCPDNPRIINYITIKTFDQEEVKHSGSTCDVIWINEILPEKLWGETIGRMRSRKGHPDSRIMNSATLLDQTRFVEELAEGSNDQNLRFAMSRGHIYENCVSSEVTEEMASEIEAKIGTRPKKSVDGGYETNGVLTRSSIDGMVANWMRVCPDQVEARKSGAFMSGGGRIYVTFDPSIHIVSNDFIDSLPNTWPVVQVVDPHSSKPEFSLWAKISPQDRLYIIDEWPSIKEFGPYENLDRRPHTIDEVCEIWRTKEAMIGVSRNIVARIGDPNRFLDPNPYNNQSLQYLFAARGFTFITTVSDDIDLGHRKVSEYLYFDRARHIINNNDPLGIPHILIAERGENINRALSRYSMKSVRDPTVAISEKINQKFKDAADVVRYLCMWHAGHPYHGLKTRLHSESDYWVMAQGRTSKLTPPRQFERDYRPHALAS
jgi:hypothetical protein